jgi:iron complex transport system ATP-binding protein
MADLHAEALTLSIGGRCLIDDVSVTFVPGELTAIIGENGAGKSTLLRLLSGYRRPDSGTVLLDGRDVAALPPMERARLLGWLPQTLPPALPVTVRDAVALGRFAHGGSPHQLGTADAEAVEKALADCSLENMANQSTAALSGGELARVHLARAVAATTEVMLVDEPLAALDPRHRLGMMQMLTDLAERQGRTMVVVVHDIGLAARFAHRIVLMRDGRILADGTPQVMVTPEAIAAGFGVEARIDSSGGWPQPLFVGPVSPVQGVCRTD